MQLSSSQAKLLIDAIDDAFEVESFRKMLRDALNINVDTISRERRFKQLVVEVVARADEEGWALALISAARDFYPHNLRLQEAAARMGVAPSLVVAMRPKPLRRRGYSQSTFEKIIRGSNSLLDIGDFRTRLGEIEYQVCRLEIAGHAVGTGFLVGPDLLMTCYHVVETIIDQQDSPRDLVARFDYKLTWKNVITNPGREFRLAPNWHIDSSPYNPAEAGGDEDAEPTTAELDFAILRLAGEPGNQPVSEISQEERPRGWIELSDRYYPFDHGSPLFIVQHPAGAPLKLALDTQAIVAVNQNGTRVRYLTNTDLGSSGSPCFNNRWELVALHHSGIVKYNEGVPTHLIARFLQERGNWSVK